MAFVSPGSAAESAAQSEASAQSMSGFAGLAELSQIGSAASTSSTGRQLVSSIISQQALANLGLAGPLYGLTPYDLAYNVQYATYIQSLLSSLSGIALTQSILGLGGAAQLANAGRRFLLSTYYGL